MLNYFIYPLSTNLLPYCIIGLATMVEGPVTILAIGAAVSTGLLLPLPVLLSIVIGNLTADFGWYGLGRFGKLEWLTGICPKVGIDPKSVYQLSVRINKHAARLLFLSKLTVGFPIPTLIAAGLSRVPPRRWIALLVLGELIKSAALVRGRIFVCESDPAGVC